MGVGVDVDVNVHADVKYETNPSVYDLMEACDDDHVEPLIVPIVPTMFQE